jgi:DNA-binding transcriptional regulator GbsR (MarR family)
VSELVKRTKISQSQISQCLAAMKAQDLVFYQREGKFVRYQLAYPEMKDALQIFRKILQKRNRRYIKPAKR